MIINKVGGSTLKKVIKFFSVLLLATLMLGQTLYVWGADNEWYELKEVECDQNIKLIDDIDMEITPYTRYIMGASVIVKRPSTDEIWMRSEVYCSAVMSKITTVFTLQKKSGSKWIDVGEGTVSVSNDSRMYKTMEATGVSSGTYRCVADTQVISQSGYSETVSVTSDPV